MKQITIKLRDNTEIQINKQYTWASDIVNELNDTRTDFINIEEHIYAKDTIASVVIEEMVDFPIEDNKNESNDNI